ncbi:MAG: hypothetical protein LBR69_03150 [Endomicrobium sp.]|jgi:2,3-bisphosphoglycerate-independent phosphoglycerate mutase|nr:hypothetical protein [Endomicrobium sp.]
MLFKNEKLEFGNKRQIRILRAAGFYNEPRQDEEGNELYRFIVKRCTSTKEVAVVYARDIDDAIEKAENDETESDWREINEHSYNFSAKEVADSINEINFKFV